MCRAIIHETIQTEQMLVSSLRHSNGGGHGNWSKHGSPKDNSAICSVAHEAVTKHDEAGRVQHYPVKRPLSHSYQNKPLAA
jgi:hypothetical protein